MNTYKKEKSQTIILIMCKNIIMLGDVLFIIPEDSFV